MASLLETLQADRARLAGQREDLDGQRQVLEADAEDAKSYDGVREPLSRLDDQITGLDRQISGLDRDIAREQARRERVRTAPVSRQDASDAADALADAESRLAHQRRSQSWSDQFLASDEWTGYRSAVAPNGVFSNKARVESPAVAVEGSILRRRGLVTGGSSTSAGAFIVSDDTGIFDEGPFQRELTILDVIRRGTTDSDVVEYVRQTGFTNNAAVVPEADSVDPTDDTGRKPWSAFTYERVVEAVATVAHGEAASLRALSDAGQMRGLIDQGLRYGLLEELEDQILNGDNSGDNFDGITHVTGTNTQIPAIDLATTIRKARTKVKLLGKARANAVVLHPLDWETLDLWLTFEGGGSNYRQASQSSAPTIWGLSVIESEGVAEGTAIVGDFRYAMLWDREQTTVRATQGYEDFFMKNLVAILAEMRAAFGVLRPKAFTIADISSFAS
jgi:HK97 family phage major capsid protein